MRKNLTILLMAVLVMAVPCILVQEVQAITLGETYSNFGFSFKYPNGMVLSEHALFDVMPNDDSGAVTGSLWVEDLSVIISVGWYSETSPPGNLEGLIYGLLQGKEEGVEEGTKGTVKINIIRGEKGETTVNGHKVVYQFYNYSLVDVPFYGIVGSWYCDVSERIYFLDIACEQDVFPLFEDCLRSFVCHQDQIPNSVSEPEFDEVPGFEAIFAITGLLAVVYLIIRKGR